jgi:hypothetical protein
MPVSKITPKQAQKMATSNSEKPKVYIPNLKATAKEKLACGTLNSFNSEAVVKDIQRLSWKMEDRATIASLGYSDNRCDTVLEFRALTSAGLVDGVHRHVLFVKGLVSDKSGIVFAAGEKLSFDVELAWEHQIGNKPPGCIETLRLVRHGLAIGYGLDGEMIRNEFQHSTLGAIKIIRHKHSVTSVRRMSSITSRRRSFDHTITLRCLNKEQVYPISS